MSVPGSSWRIWDNFPEQPPTEQDQESIVDPQSKLQPNVSLMLAGRVKDVWFGTVIHQKHS